MIDLIKRLEAATEGSRELDARIQALNYGEEFDSLAARQVHPLDEFSVVWVGKSGRRYTCWHNLAFTRSLDAALTLVPEGAGIVLERYWIASPETPVWGARILWGISGDRASTEDRATPALALCIAALKARNEGEGRA